jgi:hypothetical protein
MNIETLMGSSHIGAIFVTRQEFRKGTGVQEPGFLLLLDLYKNVDTLQLQYVLGF